VLGRQEVHWVETLVHPLQGFWQKLFTVKAVFEEINELS
jgi:hypothetical protein